MKNNQSLSEKIASNSNKSAKECHVNGKMKMKLAIIKTTRQDKQIKLNSISKRVHPKLNVYFQKKNNITESQNSVK